MALFKIPCRETQDINTILDKAKEEYKPKVTIKGKGNTLITKLSAIAETVKNTLGGEKDNYLCITKDEDFIAYCKQAIKDGVIAIDTETDGLDGMKTNLVGICIFSESQKPVYVPVGHISVITEIKVADQVSIDAVKEGLEILKQAKIVFHNAYFDLVVLYNNTGIMLNAYWDTLIASHVLNENESHNLKELYVKYILNGEIDAWHFSDLFNGIPFCYVPYDIGKLYAAKDAEMTMKLMRFQEKYLTKGTKECEEYNLENVVRLFKEDLMPMIPILVDMKLTGMEFDFDKAKELKQRYLELREDALQEFNESLKPFEKSIKAYTQKPLPYPLNYNSSDQMRVLFYDIAKIGVVYHKEPTGTGKNVINALLKMDKFKDTAIYNVAKCLLEVKTYDKALSSFIEKLTENALEHNGKIHSDLNLAGTDTGRLSSSNPRHLGIYIVRCI